MVDFCRKDKVMKTILLLAPFIFALAGCGKEITDFVLSGKDRPGVNLPSTTSSSTIATKVSPGSNHVAGSQVNATFTATPTRRSLRGIHINSTVTYHQNRVE